MNPNAPRPQSIRPDTWLAQAWLSACEFQANPASTSTNPPYIGRFAPSPSGKLHQGSLVATLASYLHAQWHGGTWLVRMEDVDTSRCTRALGEHQLATLRALGFEFAEPMLWQTERYPAYRAAFDQLRAQNHIYPCACTRSQIAQRLQALGQNPSISAYPRTCAQGIAPDAPIQSWRFRAQTSAQTGAQTGEKSLEIQWQDESGRSTVQTVDDFVLKRGAADVDDWAYQLAVVVDDAAQHISHVVRGADLLDSTARQIALQRALGYPTPQYSHAPLLTNAAGEKLSKSEQAPELDALQGVAALCHAWEFLGGAQLVGVDSTDEFWQKVRGLMPTP